MFPFGKTVAQANDRSLVERDGLAWLSIQRSFNAKEPDHGSRDRKSQPASPWAFRKVDNSSNQKCGDHQYKVDLVAGRFDNQKTTRDQACAGSLAAPLQNEASKNPECDQAS